MTPAEASTRESSSTARIASKNLPPLPPNCSGISIPINPSWKKSWTKLLSKTPFSSISLTSGRSFSSANWRTLSRNKISSSLRLVRGEAVAGERVSGIKTSENKSYHLSPASYLEHHPTCHSDKERSDKEESAFCPHTRAAVREQQIPPWHFVPRRTDKVEVILFFRQEPAGDHHSAEHVSPGCAHGWPSGN